MAYRKKKVIKKTPRKYRRKYQKKSTFSRTLLPKTYPVRFRYVAQDKYVNPTAGIPGVSVFRANDLYDPDFSGIGHQPRGFDQLMTLYSHFVVVGAKIHVTFMSPYEETHTQNAIVGISTLNSSVVKTDVNDYLEGRNTIYKPCVSTPETPMKCSLVKTFSTRKFLGRSKPLSDPELKGSTSGSPTEVAYFHCFVGETSGAIDPDATRLVVHIEYSAVLIEPKIPDQS